MKFHSLIFILIFVSCKPGAKEKGILKKLVEDSAIKVDTNNLSRFPETENKDSIYKMGDYLFEADKDLVFDFYKNDSPPTKLKSKGDTMYSDNDVTLLADKMLFPIYKKIIPVYDFDMFKVKDIYKGKMANPNLKTDPDSYGYRTRIREGCDIDTINFAGHYTIVEWGCGMECVEMAVVDRITGRVFYSTKYIPFDTADGHWLSQYKKDSRMIIVNSGVLEDYPGYCMQTWQKPAVYEWKGNGFVKLKNAFKENTTTPLLPYKKDTLPLKKNAFNRDSSKHISQKDFDLLIDNCITLLQTKKLNAISDEQHIQIMMCLNTIFMRRLKAGHYDELEKISEETKYTRDIIKVYPNWVPNRGMGFYFPQLKMELYGTPSRYAIYDITTQKK